ncbi:LytR/AlgR family response regulator transcription factor [Aquirufa antheringensis]|jgi:two-component system LytT family response regulator|uniref:Response regulator n=1 Tax=Aquirufa antheringensis TaxID=2516559 RepID=A0A4Q9BE48_9BACT|nr:LytTR family transcriptional regulator DNA-binding domain-containing protein [Aquirufa antheringensis]MCE4217332.1 response regulator [Pseudarcicella sp. GAP-15]MCZ2478574.1 response regulator [Aquirufa antheringensis]MCZ2484583.1 response regulator [Aquirufa antheringensis]MCZ2487548.1 response regulator [Aquirufa antheringensis]MCZ2489627.1 response regulator [Aquirufa antheringensis]
MKAIIVDDERLARNELKRLLENFPSIEVIGEAANTDEASQLIEELQPDVVFLDIQMPGKTGFEWLEEWDGFLPEIIFTTAFDEYALKAFEVNALDYVLKPIELARLSESIQKLESRFQRPASTEKSVTANHVLGGNDQIFVKDGEKCWFVRLDRVRLCESMGNYVRLFFDDQKPLVLKSLNSLEERLDPKLFFRCNRKHIVNLNFIEKIEPWFSGGLQVTLKGEKAEKIEISRRQSIRFKELLSL